MALRRRFDHRVFARKVLPVIALAAGLWKFAEAKDTPLMAIELFDTPKGAAYVQITDVAINGKAELRGCAGGSQKIDKSAYGKLPKIAIAGAESLERDAEGMMVLTRAGTGSCVVPTNLKLEKDEALTPAQLADRGLLQGTVISASDLAPERALAPFKAGVKLQFVAAPDVELAEYLRAQRAHSVLDWQEYLGRYPAAPHTNQAKQSSTLLWVKQGEDGLTAYRKPSICPCLAS
jgi:hypothetical protein